jgi:membrane-bound metal-dependent hydrolase YbcI (DUF457 family)
MASPIGHSIVGMALARRLGVRSKPLLAATALAASLPDADIIAGWLLHREDPWKLHRKGTHTLDFAVTAGALAGMAGILRAENIEGERDIIRDALVGAAIVGSHIVLDSAPIPAIKWGPKFLRMSLGNWIADMLIWGAVAWAIWPHHPEPEPEPAIA